MGSRYLLRRILQAMLTIAGIVVLNFILFRAMPGSPERMSHNPSDCCIKCVSELWSYPDPVDSLYYAAS